jgi:hypothetical protein
MRQQTSNIKFSSCGIPCPPIITTAWKLRLARQALERIAYPVDAEAGTMNWEIARAVLEKIGRE